MALTIPPQIMQGIFIFVMALVGLMIVAALGGITYLFMYNKQFSKTKVIIYREHKNQDGSKVPIIVDMKETGGIIKDKKLKKFVFHLRRKNVHMGENDSQGIPFNATGVVNQETKELDIPSVPCMGGKDLVFVQQLGTKKYAFANPVLVDSSQLKLYVTSADSSEALRSYDINAKTFNKKDNPLLMVGMVAVVAVVIMVMVVYFLSRIDSLVTISANLQNAGASYAAAKGASIASAAPI